jgi:hypothetical protein
VEDYPALLSRIWVLIQSTPALSIEFLLTRGMSMRVANPRFANANIAKRIMTLTPTDQSRLSEMEPSKLAKRRDSRLTIAAVLIEAIFAVSGCRLLVMSIAMGCEINGEPILSFRCAFGAIPFVASGDGRGLCQ